MEYFAWELILSGCESLMQGAQERTWGLLPFVSEKQVKYLEEEEKAIGSLSGVVNLLGRL